MIFDIFRRRLTIGELMNIDSNRQDKASQCTVSLVNVFHELKRESLFDKFRSFFNNKTLILTYYIILKLEVLSDTGKKHTVFIKLDPDFDLTNWEDNRIKIYCDCADFKFRSAYKLARHDALFLNDKLKVILGSSIVDSPKKKTKTSLLCKHSFAAVNWVISNYANIMKTI